MTLDYHWSVPEGQSLFVSNRFGTLPSANADALMQVLPGLLHRAGSSCSGQPGLTQRGSITIAFSLRQGELHGLRVTPNSRGSQCLFKAIQDDEALSDAPDGSVAIEAGYVVP